MDQEPKTIDDITRQKNGSDREIMLTACRGSKVVGYGLIKAYSDRTGYRKTCETAVYLNPSETGRGLGVRIKKELIAYCRKFGYHHVVAKVLADNKASLSYNRKVGFRDVGLQKEVGIINDRWIDVMIMQLILD